MVLDGGSLPVKCVIASANIGVCAILRRGGGSAKLDGGNVPIMTQGWCLDGGRCWAAMEIYRPQSEQARVAKSPKSDIHNSVAQRWHRMRINTNTSNTALSRFGRAPQLVLGFDEWTLQTGRREAREVSGGCGIIARPGMRGRAGRPPSARRPRPLAHERQHRAARARLRVHHPAPYRYMETLKSDQT